MGRENVAADTYISHSRNFQPLNASETNYAPNQSESIKITLSAIGIDSPTVIALTRCTSNFWQATAAAGRSFAAMTISPYSGRIN